MMNEQAFKENIRTLAQIVGLEEKEAATLLDRKIAVFVDEGEMLGCELADFLVLLLGRTVTGVHQNPAAAEGFDVSVNIGGIAREQRADVYVAISDTYLSIGRDEFEVSGALAGSNPIWALTAACYSAAQIMKFLVGEALPVPAGGSLTVRAADIFGDSFDAGEPFDIGTTWLAGAGAIGNAFVFALSLLNPHGVLHIADPDRIEGGNLNRCICFEEADLLRNKADRLCDWVRRRIPSLDVVEHPSELAKVPERDGAWLPRLVVAVDSRLARRHIQNEFPAEVYDASTTDIREFVLHFNRHPLDGLACMSCIYFQDAAEDAHEAHVAEALGVPVEDVREQFVSRTAADKIMAKYPHVASGQITGLAYDTLFKQMCGEGKLLASEDRQVFAPFAFVSVLAGVFLAIEFKRRRTGNASDGFNYWKVSPWSAPVPRAKRNREARKDCTHCSNPLMRQVAKTLWGSKE
jgi:hypothetical protein